MSDKLSEWIRHHSIEEVECIVPDLNGVLRGKVWPAEKFISSMNNGSLRMPSSVFSVTVTGDYADTDEDSIMYSDPDVTLKPDMSTIRIATGSKTPTAFVIADAFHRDQTDFEIAPRFVLKRMLDLFKDMGWTFAIAPELEFYLAHPNANPDEPVKPPIGRSGRSETSPQPYGLESMNDYEDIIEDIYEYAKLSDLHLDTMIHESGTAQLEINFNHGDPVMLSDQVLMFKRIVRQVALQHGIYATFMAKPMESQPGSAMHLHISASDENGVNRFGKDGELTQDFRHFVAGLQKYLPQIAPLFGPNVNSFRRMRPAYSAPINLRWGYDNRSCGLRIPESGDEDRRIENRLPGADANPYLAIAASLAAGYLGLKEKVEPSALLTGNAYEKDRTLPRTLDGALEAMIACEPIAELLGHKFLNAFYQLKMLELSAYQRVVSSWERDHLLLKA